MDPIEKLRQGACRAGGYLDLFNMTGSEEMKKRSIEELNKVLNDKEIEEAFDRMAWEDYQSHRKYNIEDFLIDP